MFDSESLEIARDCISKISEGWGEEVDEKCAREIAPIIEKHLKKAAVTFTDKPPRSDFIKLTDAYGDIHIARAKVLAVRAVGGTTSITFSMSESFPVNNSVDEVMKLLEGE